MPLLAPAHISLEEVNREEIVMRITATPANDDAPQLAHDVLAAVNQAMVDQ